MDLTGFQSTPGELAGRFCVFGGAIGGNLEFQSTPGELAGRFSAQVKAQLAAELVSIHARRISRAILEV